MKSPFTNPTRREFLGSAVVLPAALGFADAADTGTCGLAIGTYGLQSLDLSEAIQLVAETGYDAIEITTFPGFTGSPELFSSQKSRNTIREQVEKSEIRICALMADLQPSPDDGKHALQLDELKKLLEFAHDLSPEKPPLIQTVLGGKKWVDSKNLFRDRIADWIQIAADQRGTLSVKPHRNHAMSTPAEANWLIGQLGSSRRLKMVYDFSHYAFHEPELTIAETVAESLQNTNYVAVKDAVMVEGKVQFTLAGESGNIDHAAIIKTFHDGGYRGDFCCEVSSQIWRKNPDYNPVAATRLCYRNMATAFARAGVPRG